MTQTSDLDKRSPFFLLYTIKMVIKLEDWRIEEITGYKPITTFYMDFSIADKFGTNAIKELVRVDL